jgi:hypothetical protein
MGCTANQLSIFGQERIRQEIKRMTPMRAYIGVGKNFPTLANDKTAKRPIAVTDIKSFRARVAQISE